MKTKQNNASVKEFLEGVSNERRREDARDVIRMMREVSGKQAKMWGPSIIGFDVHHYKYADGKQGEICKIGFSPRAQALAFYLGNFDGRDKLLTKMGKHKMGNGGCMYINKLEDVDRGVLREIISRSYNKSSPPPD